MITFSPSFYSVKLYQKCCVSLLEFGSPVQEWHWHFGTSPMEGDWDDQETGARSVQREVKRSAVCSYLTGGCKEDRVRLYSDVHSGSIRQWIKFGTWEVWIVSREKLLHHKGGQTLQWVAQVVESPSYPKILKVWLDKSLNKVYSGLLQEGWTKWPPE